MDFYGFLISVTNGFGNLGVLTVAFPKKASDLLFIAAFGGCCGPHVNHFSPVAMGSINISS